VPESIEASAVVEVRSVSKTFPGTLALTDVDLDIAAGEIHALVGGNGSGKSTLVKILSGVHQADPGGAITVRGARFDAAEVAAPLMHAAGIRVVHQDLGVFPDLTVAENLALGSGFPRGRGGRIRWRTLRRRTAALIERFEIAAHPDQLMRDVTVANQTLVAIARALQDIDETRGVLMLDEPTAALPAHEVDLLLAAIRRYAGDGHSILYISHRLDEVLMLADRVSVLRDGSSVGTFEASDLTESRLIDLIVGRPVETVLLAMPAPDPRVLLEVEGLCAGPLDDITFEVRRGEVVGVAGLLGSGRSRLLRALFGEIEREAGAIRVDGVPAVFHGPRQAMASGIALVPENRATDAAFADLPIYANVGVASLSDYWRGLFLRDGRMRRDTVGLMRQFSVKADSTQAPLAALSGGNQQKVILARWLHREPRLLLLDEPTQGVDVGARSDIYRFIRQAVRDGAAVLLVASDFEELAHVADRAIVLRDGAIAADVPPAQMDATTLANLAYGITTEALNAAHN
jgi:ribose transport system ATP-binding protein